jgi:hypothetical protein
VTIRTPFIAAALVALSFLVADRFAMSLAQFTESESIGGNTVQTTSLAAPTGLSGNVVCVALVARSNQLTWNATQNATGYLVERAVGSGAFSTLSNPATASYTDTAVSAGTYKYRVRATRNNWSSGTSSEITLVQPTLCL